MTTNTLRYYNQIKPTTNTASASYPRLNSHTCLCPRQSDFVYDQTVISPCQSCLLRLNGRLVIQEYWRKPNGIRYTSMFMASPGSPSNLPSSVTIAPRALINDSGRTMSRELGDDNFLPGTAHDMNTMQLWLQANFLKEHKRWGAVAQINLDVDAARTQMLKFFRQDGADDMTAFILYYCGHGTNPEGHWVFHDGFITFAEVREAWLMAERKPDQLLIIISDSCYSGQWIKAARAAHIAAADSEQPMCSIGIITGAEFDEPATERVPYGGDFTSTYFSVKPEHHLAMTGRGDIPEKPTTYYTFHDNGNLHEPATATIQEFKNYFDRTTGLFNTAEMGHDIDTFSRANLACKQLGVSQEKRMKKDLSTLAHYHAKCLNWNRSILSRIKFADEQYTETFSVYTYGGPRPFGQPYVPRNSISREALFVASHRDMAWAHDWWYQCVDPRPTLSSFLKQRGYFSAT